MSQMLGYSFGGSSMDHSLRDHPFSIYANFSEKKPFLTPWYAHVSSKFQKLLCFVTPLVWIPEFPSKTWGKKCFWENLYGAVLLSSS